MKKFVLTSLISILLGVTITIGLNLMGLEIPFCQSVIVGMVSTNIAFVLVYFNSK